MPRGERRYLCDWRKVEAAVAGFPASLDLARVRRQRRQGMIAILKRFMVIHELAPADCAEVLSRASVGRLACCRMNQPYVVPVSIVYDPRQVCLFSFSMIGKKVEWMRANPSVCVEVEDLDDRFNWTTIVIFGRYDEISDAPEQRDQRDRALHLFSERSQWWLPGAARLPSLEHNAAVVYRINIDQMTGRRTTRSQDT